MLHPYVGAWSAVPLIAVSHRSPPTAPTAAAPLSRDTASIGEKAHRLPCPTGRQTQVRSLVRHVYIAADLDSGYGGVGRHALLGER